MSSNSITAICTQSVLKLSLHYINPPSTSMHISYFVGDSPLKQGLRYNSLKQKEEIIPWILAALNFQEKSY